VGATILAEKICGAAAEQGRPLAEVAALCRTVNAGARSMGVALTSGTVPMVGKPTFELGDDEIEIGVGIHGEPGRRRARMASADDISDELLQAITQDVKPAKDAEVLLLVNGLGGTPLSELYLLYNSAHQWLDRRGTRVTRSLVGNLTTSLEMAGASLTLCVLDDEIRRHWDSPVHTPALRWGR
jgi:phosphoenolpyruvate---glycerone phosphotransferase subunit DhaK